MGELNAPGHEILISGMGILEHGFRPHAIVDVFPDSINKVHPFIELVASCGIKHGETARKRSLSRFADVPFVDKGDVDPLLFRFDRGKAPRHAASNNKYIGLNIMLFHFKSSFSLLCSFYILVFAHVYMKCYTISIG